jgi:multidrug efflux pump subunit AcrA (membrane-fusion protein)
MPQLTPSTDFNYFFKTYHYMGNDIALIVPQKVEQFKVVSEPIIESVRQLLIMSDAEFQVAANLLTDINAKLKLWEERRVSITGPLNDSLRNANAMFRGAAMPLEAAKGELIAKIQDWDRRKQIEKQQQAREAERLRLQALKEKEEEKARLEAAKTAAEDPREADLIQREIVEVEQQQLQIQGLQLVDSNKTKVITDSGATVSMRRVKKWAVTDLDQIPNEFWKLDEAAITRAISQLEDQPDGTPAIPGVRIYFDSIPVTRK